MQSCSTTTRTTERDETLEYHSATGRTETTLRDRYDSIYVLHDRSMNTIDDTVWATEHITEFRYRYLHDTTFVERIDTVIQTHQVEKLQEVIVTKPRPRSWLDYLSYTSLLLLVLLLLYRIRSPTKFLK